MHNISIRNILNTIIAIFLCVAVATALREHIQSFIQAGSVKLETNINISIFHDVFLRGYCV